MRLHEWSRYSRECRWYRCECGEELTDQRIYDNGPETIRHPKPPPKGRTCPR